MRRLLPSVLGLILLDGCSLSFDFDNDVEKLAAESIVGRAMMESGGTGEIVPVSPCRAAVRFTPLSASNKEDGRFTIHGVPAGEHEVIISCDPDGDGSYELKYRRPGVRLEARDAVNLGDVLVVQTGTLSGMVYRNGEPAGGGVLVTLEGTDLFAYTEADGSYRIDFVPPGQYIVFATRGTEVGEKTPVTVDSKETSAADVDLHETEKRGAIAGRARIWRLEADTGHEGITVTLSSDSGGEPRTATTGPDGSYSFEDVLLGLYQLEATLADHEPARVPRVLVREEGRTAAAPDMFVIPPAHTEDGDDDIDGDGIPNDEDTDDDNDGRDDDNDAFPTDGSETDDTDGDGIGDNEDADIDGDDVMNWADDCPLDFAETVDGCPTDCVDEDEDGYGVGSGCLGPDCDDADDAVTVAVTWYADLDGDTFGDPSSSTVACDAPLDHVADSTDCDDTPGDGASVHPGADEVAADGIDQDCDGGDTCYADVDGDGHGTSATVTDDDLDCDNDSTAGTASADDDCDDDAATGPGVFPGATEAAADGVDQDCDGEELCYVDADGDGYRPGDGSATVASADLACDGAGEAGAEAPTGDCDDDAATGAGVHPGATEMTADGVDQDCDGRELCYIDADNDGYRPDDSTTMESLDADCDDAGEAVGADPVGDCADTEAAVNPGATEVVADGVDQDCNGEELCYVDGDDDGYRPGDGSATVVSADLACDGAGEATGADASGDCADDDDTIHPGATEVVADGVDQDCNGEELCYVDGDDDGYRPGDGSATVVSADLTCDGAGEATGADASGDCADDDDTIHPGATEVVADGVDQDCNGEELCYVDGDDDGYRPGDGSATVTSTDTDCDDANEAATGDPTGDCDDDTGACGANCNPGIAMEDCDGYDNDCAGGVPADEQDGDGDGYLACAGYVDRGLGFTGGGDCCESGSEGLPGCNQVTAQNINPGASETAGDGIDVDCDGVELCYVDLDGDTYGTSSTVTDDNMDCDDASLPNMSSTDGDCDDDIGACGAACNPGTAEVCDGFDNDCAGGVPLDEQDLDGDLYLACVGYVDNGGGFTDDGDCDDDAVDGGLSNPGLSEVTGDGHDNDCDGFEECYQDLDGDGYGTAATLQDDDLDCDNTSTANTASQTGDCDDDVAMCGASCSPGLAEQCRDCIDNDCDLLADGDDPGCACADADGDGFCPPDDCDDDPITGGRASPAQAERCDDGIDNDCDGDVDGADSDCGCADVDGDGYCPPADCGADDPSMCPGCPEQCNGQDNDCNGVADDLDLDGDGHSPCAASCTWVEGCYRWQDIASAPNELATVSASDDDWASVSLDFSFPFFGNTYAQAQVSTNGFVQIGSANSADSPDNQDLPDGGPPSNILAAFWDDLDPGGDAAAKVYAEQRGASPDRQLVVSWEGVPFAGMAAGGDPRISVQALLDENGGANLQYGTIVEGSDPDRATGGSATVGAEDRWGGDSAPYAFNTAQAVHTGLNLTMRCYDSDDTNPLTFTDNGCRDSDGDGYGDGCGLDYDCDDVNPLVNPGVAEVPDNGLDDDCSGGDMRFAPAIAVFVSADLGTPTGAGTYDDPLDTIQAGVDLVRLGGGQEMVVVAGGAYAEDVETDVSLSGGWDDNDLQSPWTRNLPGEPTTITGQGAADAAVTVSGLVALDGFIIQGSGLPAECAGVLVQGGSAHVLNSSVSGGDCTGTSSGIRVVDGNLNAASNTLIAGGEAVDRSSGIWLQRSRAYIEGNTLIRGQDTTATSAASLVAGVIAGDRSRATLVANTISAGVGTVVAGSRLCGVLGNESAVIVRGNQIDGGSGGAESFGVRVVGGLKTEVRANDIRVSGGDSNNTAFRLTDGSAMGGAQHLVLNNFIVVGPGVATARGASWDSGAVMFLHNTVIADGTALARAVDVDSPAGHASAELVVNNYLEGAATALDTTALYVGEGASTDLHGNMMVGGMSGTCPLKHSGSTCEPAVSAVNGCTWPGCSSAASNLDGGCLFVDPPNDLHLDDMDMGCAERGIDPMSYYPVGDDIDGDMRPDQGWDIGADERFGGGLDF